MQVAIFLTLGVLGGTNKEELTLLPLHTSSCLSLSCSDSSSHPLSPLCFIYSPWLTWNWCSPPLIVVITPALLLQRNMHNRHTKYRRGQGQIAIHWPLDACWETLTQSFVKDWGMMADLYLEYLSRLADDGCVKMETSCLSLGKDSIQMMSLAPQYFEVRHFRLGRVKLLKMFQKCRVKLCVVTLIFWI